MIEKLRALEAAATPGPWAHDGLDAFDEFPSEIDAVIDGPDTRLLITVPTEVFQEAGDKFNERQWAKARDSQASKDAALIAAARNALPVLLDVVEVAREWRNLGAGDGTDGAEADSHRALVALVAALDRLNAQADDETI